jgi:hypothetical protein
MGLDFLHNLTDQEGAAIYLLHNGSTFQERQFLSYKSELQKHTQKQIQVFSYREGNGAKLADFYDIVAEKLPAVLIVRDTDELAGQWYGLQLPQPRDVAYLADKVSH